ncbi:MAG: hypothetical protein JKY09_00995 [Crocinitomicaceae bacterium]|nr:hypothetical protein [Crocinitomicaceae bacterium]
MLLIFGITEKGVEYQLAKLKKENVIKRVGADKGDLGRSSVSNTVFKEACVFRSIHATVFGVTMPL